MPNTIFVGSQLSAQGADSGNTFMASTDNYIIAGQHTLTGGSGNDVYYVTNGTTIVEQPNGGHDTVVSSTSYVLPANVEDLVLWGNSAGFGNDQNNLIAGSPGSNLIDGGKGDDSLQGKGGADTFQFSTDSGHDGVYDWNSACTIRLAGYSSFHDFADVRKELTQVGSDTLLTLSSHDTVLIKDTNVSSLTAANFQFDLDPAKLGKMTFDEEFNSLDARVGDRATTGTWDLWGSNSTKLSDHTLAGNGEKELYVDPNFKGTGTTALGINPYSIQNGDLVITAAPTPAADKSALSGYAYTSGAVTTQHSFSQTYGYFEAKMQLPTGQGAWPAFWLLPADGSWPPELDVMEAWNDTTAVGTAHTAESGAHTSQGASTYVVNGDSQMHTYGVLWTADTLTWYVDGVAVQSQPTPADMHTPMYMLVDLAVSAQAQDPNFTAQLKIDSIKAYSLADAPVDTAADHPYWGAVTGAYGGFNYNYYVAHNPDVVAAGVDPLSHYEQFGQAEGRAAYATGSDAAATAAVSTAASTSSPDAIATTTLSTASGGMTPATVSTLTTTVTVPTVATTTSTAMTAVPTVATATATAAAAAAAPSILTAVAGDPHSYMGKDPGMPGGFNADYYLAHNPDVAASGLDPLYHYETYGKAEGRLAYDASVTTGHAYWGTVAGQPDGFNAQFYAAHNPDVAASGMDLLQHYETYGKTEGRAAYDGAVGITNGLTTDATPATAAAPALVSTTNAVASAPAPVAPAITAVAITASPHAVPGVDDHQYMGIDPGSRDGFNQDYYLSHNPDVAASGLDALYHFETYGKTEGRLAYDASVTTGHAYWGTVAGQPDGFNAQFYAAHNPDVVAAGMNLLQHYEQYGKAEGRLGYDDGSGAQDIIGTSGSDILLASGMTDKLMTGGGGADTFRFAVGLGWNTVTDFDMAHDTLDISALIAKYGTPTVSSYQTPSSSEVHFTGGETIILLGVTSTDAHHLVGA